MNAHTTRIAFTRESSAECAPRSATTTRSMIRSARLLARRYGRGPIELHSRRCRAHGTHGGWAPASPTAAIAMGEWRSLGRSIRCFPSSFGTERALPRQRSMRRRQSCAPRPKREPRPRRSRDPGRVLCRRTGSLGRAGVGPIHADEAALLCSSVAASRDRRCRMKAARGATPLSSPSDIWLVMRLMPRGHKVRRR